jgi:hypothetical protein
VVWRCAGQIAEGHSQAGEGIGELRRQRMQVASVSSDGMAHAQLDHTDPELAEPMLFIRAILCRLRSSPKARNAFGP